MPVTTIIMEQEYIIMEEAIMHMILPEAEGDFREATGEVVAVEEAAAEAREML